MIDTMHLFVTKRCTNNCPLCCNKNYDTNLIPLPSEKELNSVENIFLTGGEPFLLGEKLNKIINALRSRNNIKNIYIYTSGYECYEYFVKFKKLPNIDGINFSPKGYKDWSALSKLLLSGWKKDIANLKSNRLYVFIDKYDQCTFNLDNSSLDIISDFHFEVGCEVFFRVWIDNIESRPNEIFRRLENYD